MAGAQTLEDYMKQLNLEEQLLFVKDDLGCSKVDDLKEIEEDMLADLKPIPKKKLLKAIEELKAQPAVAEAPKTEAPKPKLVPIHEYWHEKNKDHSVHTGNAWGGEKKQGVLFHAFASEADGKEAGIEVVPVHSFWHNGHKEHTVHLGGAWGGEQKAEVMFYVPKDQASGTAAVYSFWHNRDKNHRFRIGTHRYDGEDLGSLTFYAFKEAPK